MVVFIYNQKYIAPKKHLINIIKKTLLLIFIKKMKIIQQMNHQLLHKILLPNNHMLHRHNIHIIIIYYLFACYLLFLVFVPSLCVDEYLFFTFLFTQMMMYIRSNRQTNNVGFLCWEYVWDIFSFYLIIFRWDCCFISLTHTTLTPFPLRFPSLRQHYMETERRSTPYEWEQQVSRMNNNKKVRDVYICTYEYRSHVPCSICICTWARDATSISCDDAW